MNSFQRPRLSLESLDSRLVPSATVLDLTAQGSEATAPSGAIVQQTDAQPTGTGFIRSFVRLQGAASGGGIEQGFNTDGRPLTFNENQSPQFTRSLTLGQVPRVFVDGVAYREFLLDINQKSSSSKLSLDEVRIYLGATGDATDLAALGAVFDLDSGGDVSVLLDARLNSGSGAGDMLLLVPNSLFVGMDPGSFVYLYSKFGGEAGASANSGFEEWAVKSTPNQTPAGTASLSGFVYFDANQDGVIDTDLGDHALSGVIIHLRGTNDLGDTVDLVTTTDAFGAYSFTGLRAGNYSIWETQPDGFADGQDFVGTVDGVTTGGLIEGETEDPDGQAGLFDVFTEIQLLDSDNGINYIFTEKFGE